MNLAEEGLRGDAGGTGAADEEAAGEGFFEAGLEAGGDVEILQIRTTEGAGGGLDAGEVDLVLDLLRGGIEADDLRPMAKGDPEAVLAVDRHAIGHGGIGAGIPKHAFTADGAGTDIEIEGADLFGRGDR